MTQIQLWNLKKNNNYCPGLDNYIIGQSKTKTKFPACLKIINLIWPIIGI